MKLQQDQQLIKTRDDKTCGVLTRVPDDVAAKEKPFRFGTPSNCSWGTDNGFVGTEELRPRVESWLTSLSQSEHLSLLLGSGLPNALHLIARDTTLPGMEPVKFANFEDAISEEAKRTSEAAGRKEGNIKDTASAVTHGDDFLFIAGNGVNVGGVTVPSNAATISSNGHVTAWQNLPNNSGTITGTIYANNTIIAWGNTAGAAGGLVAGIGVSSVTHLGPPASDDRHFFFKVCARP